MKRARSASPETAATDNNNNPQTGEQKQQTPYISLQQIIKLCDALDDDEASTIALAAKTLLKCSQQQFRGLCSVWGVSRRRPGGRTTGERPVRECKAELHAKLSQRALELQEKKSCGPAFCFTTASRSTLQQLQQIPNRQTLLARVIDHACHSEDSISQLVVKMLRQAEMQVQANLAADQPMDACGYIASDAVQHLRQWSLAEANSWWHTSLPDYSSMDCIAKGQSVLQCDHRILESDEVNRLVREYCNIANNLQAAEEWWAGAVALDNFLPGLLHSCGEILEPSGSAQHRWRVWIVNTQSSRQPGSHWFTVAIGLQQTPGEEMPQARPATQRPPEIARLHSVLPQSSKTATSTTGSKQKKIKLSAPANRKLDEYFGEATIKAMTWPEEEEEVPAVVTSPSSAFARLRLKREQCKNDTEFHQLLWGLNLGRNTVLTRQTSRSIIRQLSCLIQWEHTNVKLPAYATEECKQKTVHPSPQWITYHLLASVRVEPHTELRRTNTPT